MHYKETISKRKYNNMQIVQILHRYFNENPDIRFWQGLWGLGIIEWESMKKGIIEDRHSEESSITLERMEKRLRCLRKDKSKWDLIVEEVKNRPTSYNPGRKNKKQELKAVKESVNLILDVVEGVADLFDWDDEDKEK